MASGNKEKLSLILALLGYVIFGFSFLFSKKALAVASPFVLLAIRFTVAFIILNLLLLTRKFTLNLKGKKLVLLLVLGILQPVAYFICENYGVKLSTTSFVGVIIALIPVVSLILGGLFLHEKVRAFQVICVLVSVAGVFLTTLGQQTGNFSWIGFFLLLGAVAAASLFSVLTRKMSVEFSAFERTYLMFAVGCVVFISLALIQSRADIPGLILKPLADSHFWISILYLAAISSVGAFLMLNYALTHLDIARVTVFTNITTVISILAGVLILKEPFGFFEIIGSVVIIAGVYGVNLPPKRIVESV